MSLGYRLVIGLSIFAVLAMVDLRRHGREARRWKEYVFLAAVVAVAILYGVVNDLITSSISWEYFYYGKELSAVLGPQTPPERAAMRWQAAMVGVKATWSVGLILGSVMLIANNPSRSMPPLTFARLFGFVPWVFLFTACMGVVFGFIGAKGELNWCSQDFVEMAQTNLFRPSHFMTAWGVHLGGYLGGIIGGVIAACRIRAARARV
jgi:hypothetical protein